ncbi:hypothetical protein [Mesorhizobium sp. dw_380]|uniref:hypothetical protein n=1 Tax=Mesorhizobium sp. dw_380 TaxID=2812001 RepID=UPI001BDF0B7A|nr:hypothetical protein [Mesorhizobium sp. dw_380]
MKLSINDTVGENFSFGGRRHLTGEICRRSSMKANALELIPFEAMRKLFLP